MGTREAENSHFPKKQQLFAWLLASLGGGGVLKVIRKAATFSAPAVPESRTSRGASLPSRCCGSLSHPAPWCRGPRTPDSVGEEAQGAAALTTGSAPSPSPRSGLLPCRGPGGVKWGVWGQILTCHLLAPCCVALGKSCPVSGPQFPRCTRGQERSYLVVGGGG